MIFVYSFYYDGRQYRRLKKAKNLSTPFSQMSCLFDLEFTKFYIAPVVRLIRDETVCRKAVGT